METSKQLRVLNKNCFVYFNLWKCTTIMRFACVYTTFSILISVVALTTKKYIETAHIYSNWHGTLLQNHNNELDTMRIVIVMVWNKKKICKNLTPFTFASPFLLLFCISLGRFFRALALNVVRIDLYLNVFTLNDKQ